jgi:cytochrome P450
LYWGYADRYLRACHTRYGDAFTVRAFPTGTRVFLADPKDIKTVFTGDPEVFHAGEGNAVLKPVMGSRSVLLIDGEEHIAQRRRMLPAFHGDSVSNYRDVVEAATHAEIDRWVPGRPFQLMDAMRRVTLEVILRAVIGAKDPQRLSALRETLPRVADVGGTVMLLWIRPELGRVGPARRRSALPGDRRASSRSRSRSTHRRALSADASRTIRSRRPRRPQSARPIGDPAAGGP